MGDEFNKPGAWEDAWQQAFDGAEHTPPSRVWQGLENSLMEQQLRRYKRKLFLYQWLAAASVMLLGIWSGWWLFFGQPQELVLAVDQNTQQEVLTGPSAGPTSDGLVLETPPSANAKAPQGSASAPITTKTTTPQLDQANAGSVAGSSVYGSATAESNPLQTESSSLPLAKSSPASSVAQNTQDESLADQLILPGAERSEAITREGTVFEESKIGVPVFEALPVFSEISLSPALDRLTASLLLQNAEVEREIRVVGITKKGKKSTRLVPFGDFWLGASLASSFFSPNMSQGEGSGLSWSDQPAGSKAGVVYTSNVSSWDDKEHSLLSMDFKLDAAIRIRKRWMLQSSVQYGSYQVNTLTGAYTDPQDNKSYPLYYSNFNYSRVQVANPQSRMARPVDAINTYRFLSVPLSVNYVLFEGTVGMALTSGLSSEIFLGGKIEDKGINSRLETYKLTAGEDSPFRKVHFNALFGAQFFYRAGPNHLFILEPTYKQAISNFHKDGTYFDSRPSQIGLSAGFRYILR